MSSACGSAYGAGYGVTSSGYVGSSAVSGRSYGDIHDRNYSEWRQRQRQQLDRDYDEYRREHQSQFEPEFGGWRARRQNQTPSLRSGTAHMEGSGSDRKRAIRGKRGGGR